MEVELLFLNGKSLLVDMAEGLPAAKMKAAEVLGAPAEALSINAGGLLLTQEMVWKWLEKTTEETSVEGPFYVVVDQDRLELAQVLADLKEDIQLLKKQDAVVAKLKAAWELRKLELPCLQEKDCKHCIRAAERSLKEGVPSLLEEKALVSRLSKLCRLQSEQDQVFEEQRRFSGLYCSIMRKADKEKTKLRQDLAQEMVKIFKETIDEYHPYHREECGYWSPEWIEKYMIKPQLALGSFDDETLRQVCPRFDRREVWQPKNRKCPKVAVCKAQSITGDEPEGELVEARTMRFRSKKPRGRECRAGRLNRIRHDLDLELC